MPTQPSTQDDQARIEDLKDEIDYLRDTLTTTIRQLDDARDQAAAERERADILQREALQRVESLTASAVDRQRGVHELVGSPERNATPADDSGHDDDDHHGAGSLWQRVMRVLHGA